MQSTRRNVSAKQLGSILIVLAIILALIILSSTQELMIAADIACRKTCGLEMGSTCPHAKSIPLESYVGFSVSFILAGVGVFMISSARKYKEEVTEKEHKFKKMMDRLGEDEKKICEIIRNEGGALFQSDLIEKSEYNKVKVSRILDKLEGKGLVERRRRGMTNLVLLKSS